MWQHFFWIFGHPEVYILIIPAFACVSEIIPVFSRKPIFGYPVMVAATVMIGAISVSVWAHHMFSGRHDVGGQHLLRYLRRCSWGIPTGIKIFNWLGTMYGGKIRLENPMLFCLGFLFQFLIAGLTGVMLAVAPFNWQLTDSYFVVAHFHYTLVGSFLFAIFAASTTGIQRRLEEGLSRRLGRWHFWLFLIGFHLTFDPQHIAGILGMPRRVYTFDAGRGVGDLQPDFFDRSHLPGCGPDLSGRQSALIAAPGGKRAGDDPWDAWTLEWATTSPPPEYNFEALPEVRSRRPLWDLKHPEDPDWKYE